MAVARKALVGATVVLELVGEVSFEGQRSTELLHLADREASGDAAGQERGGAGARDDPSGAPPCGRGGACSDRARLVGLPESPARPR
jgi:hypothetical protein